MLASTIGTKSISQIKNYYYDHKKLSGRYRSNDSDKADEGDDGKSTGYSDHPFPGSTDGESDFAEREEQQFPGGIFSDQGRSEMETGEASMMGAHSLASAADLWAQVQILKQHQQQQHQQQMMTTHEARRLLQSRTHQQVMSNFTGMFPWVTAAHVAQAQAQAAALQQQQQQQDGNVLGASHWVDRK